MEAFLGWFGHGPGCCPGSFLGCCPGSFLGCPPVTRRQRWSAMAEEAEEEPPPGSGAIDLGDLGEPQEAIVQ